MFNRTFVTVPERPVNVHVEQQPLDAADAARLYGQLKDRAEDAVSNAVVERCGANNELVCVSMENWSDYRTDTMNVRVLFKINGNLHEVRCSPDRHDLASQMYRTIADYVAGEVWKKLADTRKML